MTKISTGRWKRRQRLKRRDRGDHPYNVEVTPSFEKDFGAIEAQWPLAVDALDACWSLLVQDPFQAGIELAGHAEHFVMTTARMESFGRSLESATRLMDDLQLLGVRQATLSSGGFLVASRPDQDLG